MFPELSPLGSPIRMPGGATSRLEIPDGDPRWDGLLAKIAPGRTVTQTVAVCRWQ